MAYSVTTCVLTAAGGLFVFYLLKLYRNVRALPPGPYPLPILGNLLMFMTQKRKIANIMEDLGKKYNGIYTLWIGTVPFVVVANWELMKEGLISKTNDIISRPQLPSLRHQLDHTDAIAFEGYNKKWEVCRKVGLAALRKFSDGEHLAVLIKGATNDTIEKMLDRTVPFNPAKDLQELVFNIISETAFGVKSLSEEERDVFRVQAEVFHSTLGVSMGDFFPLLLRPFFYFQNQAIKEASKNVGDFLFRKYAEINETFQSGEIRHFSDSIIYSGKEAEAAETNKNKYLTKQNMNKILGDLFFGGTETTRIALTWSFLAFAQYPLIQSRVRKEIDENIGSRMPLQSDKANCHYTWAFVSEILRTRAPLPLLVPHTANVDTSLGDFKIPKGTNVVFDAASVHLDSTLWQKPETFNPERFLDAEGRYENKRFPGYLPFGEGKRLCIGEKMGRQDLFLVISNLVQKAEVFYSGEPHNDFLAQQNNAFINLAKDFNIYLKPRN